jgi:hypothetical protein
MLGQQRKRTFVCEIYWQGRAFAIYEDRNAQGVSIPDSVCIECLDGANDFSNLRFAEISHAITAIHFS